MYKINILVMVIMTLTAGSFAAVTLTESQIDFKTYTHTVNEDYSLQNDTFSTDIVTHTYNSLVMENEYLKVTLVPEYGGRIVSMIYKPTGHEQLYQNPVGRPYGPQWDAFFYDWLMIWGGIFPTFPEPEHGKAWCRPWAYEITRQTDGEVSVKMSFTDDITFTPPSTQFAYGTTNITCQFEVTLSAKSSALKTSVTLINGNSTETNYEYWTNVGVAPGSEPGKSQCDDQTELVGPVSKVKIYDDWPEIRAVEQNESGDIYQFDNLRWYKNWAADGIAYAWPVEGNFWGAVNHGNNEGIIRISDNEKTPGLKLWGFGYNQSRGFDPETSNEYRRPFVEMWAGVSKEFFSPATLAANETLQFDEYYVPTVGMTEFTHAGRYALINLSTDKSAYDGNSDQSAVVSCQYVVTETAAPLTVQVQFRGEDNSVTVFEETKTYEKNGPFDINDSIAVENLCDDIDSLIFLLKSDSDILMSSSVPVSFKNAGTCKTSVRPGLREHRRGVTAIDAAAPRMLFGINGVYLGDAGEKRMSASRVHGVVIAVDRQGRCVRSVRVGDR